MQGARRRVTVGPHELGLSGQRSTGAAHQPGGGGLGEIPPCEHHSGLGGQPGVEVSHHHGHAVHDGVLSAAVRAMEPGGVGLQELVTDLAVHDLTAGRTDERG